MTVIVPNVPTPVPQASDPINFDARADAYHVQLPITVNALNAQNVENNALNASTNTAAATASGAALAAQSFANASLWVASTNYAQGTVAISRLDFLPYRRIVAGTTATDPANDPTNWVVAFDQKAIIQLAYGLSMALDQAALAHRRVDDALTLQTQTGTATIAQAASTEHQRTYATVAVTLPKSYRTTDYQVVIAVESAAPAQGHEGTVFVQSRATNGFVIAMTGSATSASLRWKVMHPAAQ